MNVNNKADRFTDAIIIIAICVAVALKITGVIRISWLWFLSPLWITFGLGLILAIFVTVASVIFDIIRRRKNK